jgi:hypothetical protein
MCNGVNLETILRVEASKGEALARHISPKGHQIAEEVGSSSILQVNFTT